MADNKTKITSDEPTELTASEQHLDKKTKFDNENKEKSGNFLL